MRYPLWQTIAASAVLLVASFARAEDRVDYLREIKPIFQARCYACHGALKQESDLRLDTGALIRQGGASGKAILPGNTDKSLLLERITSKDLVDRMPPEGDPLTADQINAIRRWISQGADSPKEEQPEKDLRSHWAFQRLNRPTVPMKQNGENFANPIDAFLAVEHRKHNLAPQAEASRAVLLRRVTLDLTGLPPTQEELSAFLKDDSPDAYERIVERLLNSPRYGERWGRHWMDVWRYSDWYGRRNVPDVWNSAPQIWRWRDWIVRSLNEDRGYDRMIHEMLAADEIAPADYEAGHATGYLIRNWYALNPNDWMRNIVEHTGKAFLGLTFNCAHCHDHKYDPIAHEDYFRFRAFFEPIGIRQDRVPGEADPGPFQEYNYSTLRKVQRLGAVRIFDKSPEAPTWFYTGGDERNRVKERGSIAPGVPAFLSQGLPEIATVDLPPTAWYPGLREGIQETLLADARAALAQAETELAAATKPNTAPLAPVQEQLKAAEAAYAEALSRAKAAGEPGALAGRQSLVLNAETGRRLVQNPLQNLKALDNGSTLEFQLLILKDAHFNFQLAKDHTKGLTAGYVGFDQGRILSYQPGSFSEFEAGRYDFAGGQNRFLVSLILETAADRCLLSVRSLPDDKLLVDRVPVALNGWNPVGDPTKAITFDARTGSVAVVDEIVLSSPSSTGEPLCKFDFEPPSYPDGRDVVGLQGWLASSYNVAPASSIISQTAGNEGLRKEWEKLEAARRAVRRASLPQDAAQAKLAAARATLTSLETRMQADEVRYLKRQTEDAKSLIHKASRLEGEAAVRRAEADVLSKELALHQAEAKPADDANRAKGIQTATNQLTAARAALDKARAEWDQEADNYTAFGPQYPQTSTGRRRALAAWMTNRENPLTARVAVNHIWMRHFHQPLVATVSDFGRNGAAPTHPELLDWLAMELIDSEWSMKHLHRLIVTSAAYRRVSSAKNSDAWVKIDPENRWLWRMNSGRMEAEVVRDSVLFCGGVLESTMGGQERENAEALTTHRRTLYYSVYPEQGGTNALGDLFDAPNPLECYRRTRSILPQQALALTNGDLVHQMSAAVVQSLSSIMETKPFITAAFERILSRTPTALEVTVCQKALAEHRQLASKTAKDESAIQRKARASLVRALFNHNDFLTIR